MIDQAFVMTLAFALVAGVATFFSPCAFPLLPGYVGFYVSQTEGKRPSLAGATARGLVAGGGVLATFLVLIGAAFVVGRQALTQLTLLEPVVGGLLVVFGVLVVIDRAPSLSIVLPKRRSSVLGFGVFGVGYALAAAGCVASAFLSVIALSLSLSVGPALLVLGTYVGGIVLLMVALTVATGMGLVANASRFAAYGKTFERLAGAVMIVAGFVQIYIVVFTYDVF